MQVPLLDLKKQYETIREEIRPAVDEVMDSQYFIGGPNVQALENEAGDYCQCRFATGVSSGTDALIVSLMALGIQPGDEVITTPYTFFATVGSISRLGAVPVFVDIDPLTYNIDVTLIEAAVTSKTKVIIPVHLYGQVADMDPILEIARKHNLKVVEDAAQAIGSEYKGRRAGSIGDLGCFSFFPSKNLGAFGDGGMVTANDEALAEKVALLRNHGAQPKYYHKFVGGNFRLDALQAAVLRIKLKYLDSWTEGRQANAEEYRKLFTAAEVTASSVSEGGVVLPTAIDHNRHIYNQFVIRVPRRDDLMAYLKEKGIGTEIYYPVPMHLQECFSDLGFEQGSLPHAESAARETLALPIFPELTSDQQCYVVESIASFLKEA